MVASLTESRPPKLEDVRIKFASVGLMRSLLADKDPTICVTSHSIPGQISASRLRAGLAAGRPRTAVEHDLQRSRKPWHRRHDSFVYGVLSYPTGDLPVAQALFRGHARSSHENRKRDGHPQRRFRGGAF